MQNKIIFFTKAPEPGFGKSRLKGFMSQEQIYALTVKLIKENFYTAIDTGITVSIYYSGKKENLLFLNTGTKTEFKLQEGNGLGDKMFNALKAELEHSEKVILIGSDLVNITKENLQDAFKALDKTDIVIAPSKDGGYGIIGMKTAYNIFSGITFSTSNVYADTLKSIAQKKLTYTELPVVKDLDTKEDLITEELKTDSVKLIGQGEYNINYLFNEKYVFRINIASQLHLGNKQIEYEFNALKELEKTGVTPKAYSYTLCGKYLPYGSLIMEYLEGRPLNYDTDMETAAFLLAKIHNHAFTCKNLICVKKPFKAMFKECGEMYSYYKNWENREERTVEFIEKFFNIAKKLGLDDNLEKECIINTELNNRNFIIGGSKEKSYIIDWEKPLIGEREQDLAHFLVPTTTNWKTEKILSEDEIKNFLSLYERYGKINRKKLDKYMIFNCLRGITWCSMARVEYENNRTLSNSETFEKIKKFIGVEFLKYIYNNFYEVYDV
ncbi:TIGR04282 family arsenosugar biosynthesis glycosyltransferase [Treponema pedis]|uniref:TIGR04282 family arsenosugar biosynthesis glycosyltransferase n=1 Tax=Treponema pedis TaxID=409322 RepID=UPI0003FE565F|nr:TIGR04282 family arsenosugar biosynthesis glycosyltransferase [Treponema pedis]